MSIKKTCSVAVIIISAISLFAVPVHAQSLAQVHTNIDGLYDGNSAIVVPAWSETSTAMARISTSGTTVFPSMHVRAMNFATRIFGTMILEESRNGSWVSVASWAVSGTGVLNAERTFSGTSGTTYRTRFVVTVGSERIERTSASVRA